MLKLAKFLAVVLALATATPALAGTVIITDTFTFGGGAFAGDPVVIEYRYPTLPPGQAIETYIPAFSAMLTFLDLSSTTPTSPQIIFSGSSDILNPEFYTDWAFDPTLNAENISDIVVDPAGLFLVIGGNLTDTRDFTGSTFARTAEVVPLPATGGLLVGAFALLAAVRRTRRGSSPA